METGEIIAIVVVVLVLVLGASFLCFRCCKAILQVVEDDQKPVRQTFLSSMRDGFRRSFRSSIRRVSGLRNSFRRSGRGSGPNADSIRRKYETAGKKPVVSIATIQDLKKESSELHPAYMKKAVRSEGVSEGENRGQVSHTNYPNPLYQRDLPKLGHDDKRSGYKGAKPAITDKIRSGRSGYKKMEEEASPTHKATSSAYMRDERREQGYDNHTYQEGAPHHAPPVTRYDLPYEAEPTQPQHLPQGHQRQQGHLARVQGQPTSEGQFAPPGGQPGYNIEGQPRFDLSREDVRIDNPEKRYMSVDTYI